MPKDARVFGKIVKKKKMLPFLKECYEIFVSPRPIPPYQCVDDIARMLLVDIHLRVALIA